MRNGAVWAALVLAAGLATAPVSALAEEPAGTATGTGSGATATTQDQPAAEGKAPAASSDRGTYQEAGLHAVTIAYVDQSGNRIAPSYKRALADGESYSVASPKLGGYELVNASQATVAGTVTMGSGDVSVQVVYKSARVTYKVVHERQVGSGSGEYRVAETQTFQAPAGSRVTVVAKHYDN